MDKILYRKKNKFSAKLQFLNAERVYRLTSGGRPPRTPPFGENDISIEGSGRLTARWEMAVAEENQSRSEGKSLEERHCAGRARGVKVAID